MLKYLFVSTLLLFRIWNLSTAVIISAQKQHQMEEAQMDPKQYERVHNQHMGWYIRAMNSLMGAVGREMYLKMNRFERSAFLRCLDQISGDHDLQAGAMCLSRAFDKTLEIETPQTTTTAPTTTTAKSTQKAGQLKSVVIRRKVPPPSSPKHKESARLKRLRQRVNRIENIGHVASGGDKKVPIQRLNYNVKSRVGSWDNANHVAGGGQNKVPTQKLNFKEKAKPRIESHMDIQKLQQQKNGKDSGRSSASGIHNSSTFNK